MFLSVDKQKITQKLCHCLNIYIYIYYLYTLIVAKIQMILPCEPKTREEFLQCKSKNIYIILLKLLFINIE